MTVDDNYPGGGRSPSNLGGEAVVAPVELSVVMPCLNEAETLGTCIKKALETFKRHDIAGEVVIGDNGSTDGSQAIATELGARVVAIPERGYGNALRGAIEASIGTYILMGDSDDSYDFREAPKFLDELRQGHDLVMGNRFRGGIHPGAMPPLHQYFGNPALTFIGRTLFSAPFGDFYCGLRAFRKDAIERMDLRATGMEYAYEMIVKATMLGMKMTEVPTPLWPDGRSRPPHLRSWRDGWRTLRFMLLYSPRWLFLYPGMLLIGLGTVFGGLILPGPLTVGSVKFDAHTLLFAAAAVMVGYQAVVFSVFSKTFAITAGLMPPDPRLERLFKMITLETGLLVSAILLTLGFVGTLVAVSIWGGTGFGSLDYAKVMRLTIPSVLAIVLGFQTLMNSFFLSLLGLGRK